jgi:glycosyltransferase involved in cell wall biosynthesis
VTRFGRRVWGPLKVHTHYGETATGAMVAADETNCFPAMKLLFVHDHLGAWGGAETNLFEVASALRHRGHELALVHGTATGKNEDAWRELFPVRFAAGEAGATGMALQQFRPSAVFLHNSPGLAVTAALATGGVPVVRMVHDHHLFCLRGCRYPAWSRQACTRPLSAACLIPCGGFVQRGDQGGWVIEITRYFEKKRELELHRGFARLLVASEYMRAELRRNGFADAQIEIHAPVPSRPAPAAIPERSGHRIIYAGQIVRGKGVDVLLESLAHVQAPFECVILGDGSHRPYCEDLCRRLGLADRVRFAGYVPSAEVDAYYRSATLALFSSVWPEPFGLSGLEALRHGLPVVAFDVGGVREWLEDGVNGLLAPWMNRKEFAQRVDRILGDPGLARQLGEQGRALAAERFNFSRYIDGLEDLFGRVAAPASAAAGGVTA